MIRTEGSKTPMTRSASARNEGSKTPMTRSANVKKNKVLDMQISKLYRSAFSYLSESKVYIFVILALFVASTLPSFLFPSFFSGFDKLLTDIIDETEGLSAFSLMFYILKNNFQSSLFGMLFGVVFSIFPIGATLLNGALLGYVLRLSWGVSGLNDFWRILPHGIFELPAVFISLGLGVRLGTFVLSKQKLKSLKYNLYNALLVFALVVVPLLIIAAIIEGTLIAIA